MLTRIEDLIVLARLLQQSSAACAAFVLCTRGLTDDDRFIFRILQQLPDKGRGLLPVRQNGDRGPGSRESDIEKAPFFCMFVCFGCRENEVQNRIIDHF